MSAPTIEILDQYGVPINSTRFPALQNVAEVAKTDEVGLWDTSLSGLYKTDVESIFAATEHASVSPETVPSGSDTLIPCVRDGEFKSLAWSVISGLGASPASAPLNHPGRLSAVSNVAQPMVTAIGASTLYYVPDQPGVAIVKLYNGSSWDAHTFTAQLSLSLAAVAVGFYDVFLYSNSGTLTLELSTVWTDNFRKRANAVTMQDGVPVKSGSTERRLVGFIYVYSTGLVTQSRLAAENGVISVQDMPNPDNEHWWYGDHCGWMIPWGCVPMVREAQMRGTPKNLRVIQDSSAISSTGANQNGAYAWNFRRPHQLVQLADQTSTPRVGVTGPADLFTCATSWTGSTPALITTGGASLNGCPRRWLYDPVGDKHYISSGALTQVYRLDTSALSSSAPAGLNKRFHAALAGASSEATEAVWNPSDGKFYGTDNSSVLWALDPSADTFGSSLGTITGAAGQNFWANKIGFNPVNGYFYISTGGNREVKVVNTSGTVIATITLTANNYFGGGRVTDCIFCPTTGYMHIFGCGNGDSASWARAVLVDASHNIVRVQQIAMGGNTSSAWGAADYIPGWDCFIMLRTYSRSNYGTNDSLYSRVIVVSPHATTPDPGTTYNVAHANKYGCGIWVPLHVVNGATPSNSWGYHAASSGGIWVPTHNMFRAIFGANASYGSLYHHNLHAEW